MINKQKAVLFALLILVLAPALLTAAEDALVGKADAVYLEVRDAYTLGADGTILHRHAHTMRTETHYALHSLTGESFVVYNPAFQELKIHRSRTTMRDGKEVDSTPNAFNEVLPRYCDKARPYMGLREMVVTHLGMEPGAVVAFDYEVRSKPGFLPHLMGEEIFGGVHPILKKAVEVTVPEGTALHYRLLNHEPVEPQRIEGKGTVTYRWLLERLPLVPREGMAAATADCAPRLVFTTCPTWGAAAKGMAERFDAARCCPSAFDEVIADARKKASDPVGLMRALNRFVASDTVGAAVPAALTGYRVLPASDTFRDSVGTGFDRCALLLALLRAAGLDAEPVLASVRDDFACTVPSWLQFAGCRILCRPGGSVDGAVLLDPARAGGLAREERLAGGTIFRFAGTADPIEKLPGSCACANRVKARVELALDGKLRVTGRVLLDVSGDLNPFLELSEGFERWAGSRMKKLVPGARFGAVSARLLGADRSVFAAEIAAPAPLPRTGPFAELTLPGCPGGAIDMHVPLASPRRATPLVLPRGVTEELELTLVLPDGVSVAAMPRDLDLIGLPAELRVRCDAGDGELSVQRRLCVKSRVAAEDYPALRSALIEWSAPDARRVLLKPSEPKAD